MKQPRSTWNKRFDVYDSATNLSESRVIVKRLGRVGQSATVCLPSERWN